MMEQQGPQLKVPQNVKEDPALLQAQSLGTAAGLYAASRVSPPV